MVARGTAQLGSITIFIRFQVSFMASMISSSVAVKMSETKWLTKCQVSSFNGTFKPSATVPSGPEIAAVEQLSAFGY